MLELGHAPPCRIQLELQVSLSTRTCSRASRVPFTTSRATFGTLAWAAVMEIAQLRRPVLLSQYRLVHRAPGGLSLAHPHIRSGQRRPAIRRNHSPHLLCQAPKQRSHSDINALITDSIQPCASIQGQIVSTWAAERSFTPPQHASPYRRFGRVQTDAWLGAQ